MPRTFSLPSLHTIPENIDDQLRHLIHNAPELVTQAWLCDLIKNSGHLTTPEYLRWRVVALIWLAAAFDIEQAWPYLMWFNMGEPTIGDHLNEIITDGVEEMQCHLQLAGWLAQSQDERLRTFFSTYKNIPPPHKIASILRPLVSQPRSEAVGVWLAGFCRDTADNPSPLMRSWHLLGATWVATCFDSAAGLSYLKAKSEGQPALPAEDNDRLTEAAGQINAVPNVIQWIAGCPDPDVKTMLRDFGHPDLAAVANAVFESPPDYENLTGLASRAATDAAKFSRNRQLLEQAGLKPKQGQILDVACGPLAPQTLLLNSVGYGVTGVDLHIPPDYLPVAGIKQRFKKGKYVSAWKAATAAYYQALAQNAVGLKLSWKKVRVELADLTRLELADGIFDAALCIDHLQHAPDVTSLLAEIARVLKPDGLFIADVTPYASLAGQLLAYGKTSPPWGHLRGNASGLQARLSFNQWRETQYRSAIDKYFTIEQWLTEQDAQAAAQLTPDIRARLTGYSNDELTRKQIVVVARKKGQDAASA